MMDGVFVPKEVYKELRLAELKLNCLEAYGVDNWCGYVDAMDEYEMQKEEYEDNY